MADPVGEETEAVSVLEEQSDEDSIEATDDQDSDYIPEKETEPEVTAIPRRTERSVKKKNFEDFSAKYFYRRTYFRPTNASRLPLQREFTPEQVVLVETAKLVRPTISFQVTTDSQHQARTPAATAGHSSHHCGGEHGQLIAKKRSKTLPSPCEQHQHLNRQSSQPHMDQTGEDPNLFLEELEQYFHKQNIEPTEWTSIAAAQLRGSANTWFENYRSLRLDYPSFCQRLLDKYNNLALVSQMHARLYGEKQRSGEDTAVFIAQKLSLFRRLAPGLDENIITQQVRELLTAEIRINLRGAILNSIDQLTQIATAIEADLREQQTAKITTTRSATTSPGRGATSSQESVVTPANRSGPRAENSRGATYAGENRNASQTDTVSSQPRIPPYLCRFCGAMHFHRDCAIRQRSANTDNILLALPPPEQPQPRGRNSQNSQNTETRQTIPRAITAPPENFRRAAPTRPATQTNSDDLD
ncbi:hypothetical protein NQ314_017111 [Rhamnusium bicolor]|uniref:Retrotransposon gag domain-containing protein n=1 Tax=Rhamnusium bicolor TaxID=1586634 RepID=A0AAV8WUG1_9CUCU|nr:hypothetical protein NQ314_017111 [Rhamnusium bicolor]